MSQKQPYRRDTPFFQDPATHDLIEQVATATSLTIFVGAGVSLDRGSLTWDELVARLLNRQLQKQRSGTGSKATLRGALAVGESLGPVAAASAVRELYRRERPHVSETALMELIADDMYQLLYPSNRWSPGGALAEAVVRLAVMWKSLGRRVSVITTNYDNNIEEYAGDQELEDLAKEKGLIIEPYVDLSSRVASKTIPVYHLNGYIPYGDTYRGNLAFSESGLALGREVVGNDKPGLDWRPKLLDKHLRASTTIFVGTTLRDPTVVAGLIKTRDAGTTCPRFGVFPYQADAWRNEEPTVRAAANAALDARLAHLDVEPIRPDFYGQVAQLVNEVVNCRLNGSGDYKSVDVRYSDRLSTWYRSWSRSIDRVGERYYQDRCQELLADARDQVRSQLSPKRDELLKLEIWIRRDPKKRRELELWGNSGSASRSTKGNARGHIENQSRYVAVRALCQGFDLRGPLEAAGSRWHSHFSLPVVLQGAPWHRLPVGVLNLLSSRDEKTSCLAGLDDPTAWLNARRTLTDVGRAILDPDTSEWASR